MRLTLRTLLAYLDDVLDPVDKEELATKIESSEFAEDLVHRTRDAVRRLRLSAPQVIGTGMGLDPNTVAEYLDNVMPPDQVGDFERICLESDVHLAEATACHHVLTMVLGEPADVDPIARQRMYTIASEAKERRQIRMEPAHTAPTVAIAAAGAMPAAAVAPTVSLPPRAVEVPEYLRTGAWWQSTGAVISLATVVLIGTAIVLLSGLPGWLGGKPALEPITAQKTAPPVETPTATTPELTAPAPAESPSAAPLGAPPQPLTPGIPSLAAGAANASPPVETEQPAATTSPSGTPPQQPATTDVGAAGPPAETAPASDDFAANLASTQPAASLPALPGPTPATAPAGNESPAAPPITLPSAPPAETLSSSTPPPTATTPAAVPGEPSASDIKVPPDDATPPVPLDIGTYMGSKTVLLRYDDKAGAWFRIEPRAAVMPGERLLSLPEFRPKVALASGIHLDISGGTAVIMGAAAEGSAADPAIEVVYGRIVLVNPTNNDQQVRLKLGPNAGVAKIARNKTLAAEVERKFVPGQDPRQTPAPVETRLFAPDGGVVWNDAAGEKAIEKPSRWTLTAAGAADIADDAAPPEWIDHEPIVQLSEQRYGAPVIESTLVSNVPAVTQLLELFQGSSRKEVKSLVARSSIHVGLFQPFIDALRDSEQKANWKTHIDTLRTAMALSPESANKVWQALADQRGKPAAGDLYEMLCSYSPEQVGQTPEQIKSGPLVKLINWLEDDSLDYRVLAVRDLAEITGKQFMQNPAAKLQERTQNVRRWRDRLEAGELKPVSQP
jgi:hypothetical protein